MFMYLRTVKTIIPLGMTGLLCVCVLCYCTQLSQYLQCNKLYLCVAGTMFFLQIQLLYSYTCSGSLLWIHGSCCIHSPSRTYFSFPTHFHEFAKGFSLSITTQIPWDQLSSELRQQIHYCTIPSHFKWNSYCLHYPSLLCSRLRANPSYLKRSMNFMLMSQN